MPRAMPQDKERLYAENMKLKNRINELEVDNTKLKTKI